MTRGVAMRTGLALVLVWAVGAGAAMEGRAASGAPRALVPAEEVSLYQGQDRVRRLAEGARREGQLSLYSSMNARILRQVVDAFRQWLDRSHGIKPEVEVWRGSSEDLLQRTLLEARAGRHQVDVLEANGNDLEILKREGITARFWSPSFGDYPEGLRDPDGYWHATRLNIFTQSYNTGLVQRSELPRAWQDLLNPRWRGRVAIESTDWDWFAAQVKAGTWGSRDQVLAFFDRLRAADLQLRTGHALLAELLAAGEVDLALTTHNYTVQALKDRGAPVEWFAIDPAVARPNGVAVPARLQHPHLAMLFVDFLLSPEGQAALDRLNVAPASPRVQSRLTQGFRYVLVDVRTLVDEASSWQQLWEQAVVRRP